jgi:hypothetical protein
VHRWLILCLSPPTLRPQRETRFSALASDGTCPDSSGDFGLAASVFCLDLVHAFAQAPPLKPQAPSEATCPKPQALSEATCPTPQASSLKSAAPGRIICVHLRHLRTISLAFTLLPRFSSVCIGVHRWLAFRFSPRTLRPPRETGSFAFPSAFSLQPSVWFSSDFGLQTSDLFCCARSHFPTFSPAGLARAPSLEQSDMPQASNPRAQARGPWPLAPPPDFLRTSRTLRETCLPSVQICVHRWPTHAFGIHDFSSDGSCRDLSGFFRVPPFLVFLVGLVVRKQFASSKG